MGSVGQNSSFSEHGHVAYQIKENQECNTMVANSLPADTPPPPIQTLGMGSVGQNSTFSEHGHVAYQFKENQECSNMVANIMPADPPSPNIRMGLIVKFQLCHNMVMLHIKLKGITKCSYTVANICLQNPIPLYPADGVNRSKFDFFQNMVMFHIKLKGIMKCSNTVANILPADPPSSPLTFGMGSIGQKLTFRTWSCCISN